MRRFHQISADGRTQVREAETLSEVMDTLDVARYQIAGEYLDGFILPPLPDGLPHYTLATYLIHNHGDELLEWLRDELSASAFKPRDIPHLGTVGPDKPRRR